MSLGEPAAPALRKQPAQTELEIVSFGYELAGLFAGQPSVTIIPGAPDDAAVAAIVGTLADALARSRRLVVLAADWIDPAEDRRLRTALMVLDSDRVAIAYSDLPPLAGGVLAVLAAALADQLGSPGLTLGTLDRIAAELVAVAWLRSISGLRRPSPSLMQHAASLVPSRGFVVGVAPEEFVLRAARAHDAGLSPAPQPTELVFADRNGDRDWVTRAVVPALGGLRAGEVDPPSRSQEWWGTGRLTEVVAYPPPSDELAQRAADGLSLLPCGWCDTSVVALPCPFCGHSG